MNRMGMRPLSRRVLLAAAGTTLLAPALRAATRELSLPISSTSFAAASVRSASLLGSFERHGLALRFVTMDSGSTITTALVSGSVPVILGGPGEMISAAVRGQPILLLTNIYWGLSASLILATDVARRTGVDPAAPVQQRLKALDGLVIASPSATSSYTASYKGAASAAGANIHFTYMSQPAMVAAVESGAIQGAIAGAPLWGGPVSRGKAVLWLSGPRGDLPPENTPTSVTSFNAMRPFAEANPDLMRQLLDGYRDFSGILERSPERVRATFAQLYPDVDTATMDLLFAAEHRAWLMRDVTLADMRHEIAFMRASGMTLPGLDALDPASLLYVPPR